MPRTKKQIQCSNFLMAGVSLLKHWGFDEVTGRFALYYFEQAVKHDSNNQESLWWYSFLYLVFHDDKLPHKNTHGLAGFKKILKSKSNPDKGLWKQLSTIILNMVARKEYGDFVDRIDEESGKLLLKKYKHNFKI